MDQKEAQNRSSALPYAAPKFLEGIVKKKRGRVAWSLPMSSKQDRFLAPMWTQNADYARLHLHRLLFPAYPELEMFWRPQSFVK